MLIISIFTENILLIIVFLLVLILGFVLMYKGLELENEKILYNRIAILSHTYDKNLYNDTGKVKIQKIVNEWNMNK